MTATGEPTYTMQQALDQMYEMSKDVAHLIGVANIDVADEYGDANAEPRELFLAPSPQGGDKATVYARRLARMLLERMLTDFVIHPKVDPEE